MSVFTAFPYSEADAGGTETSMVQTGIFDFGDYVIDPFGLPKAGTILILHLGDMMAQQSLETGLVPSPETSSSTSHLSCFNFCGHSNSLLELSFTLPLLS